jgi:signal peptidase I
MKRFSRRAWLLAIPGLVLATWLAWSGVLYATSLRLFLIPTTSMAPTLTKGDRIAVDTRGGGNPRRGELWVFTMPNGAAGVKRVIGLPGETIEVKGGQVLIDGKALAEPYLSTPPSYTLARVTLGPEQYFLLGDNRNASFDSHVWGPAPRKLFIGRVEFRPWPPSRIGGLR